MFGLSYLNHLDALQQFLSIPTMVSMTHCLKQLIKRLWCLPNSPCVTWPTCESLLSHSNDLWWTLLKTIHHSYFMSTMYHTLHPFVYDVDRISWLGPRRMTMHQKVNVLDFLIHVQKEQFWKKNQNLTILLSSFGLHLSSLLVKCVEDVACKSSHNIFYKKT